MALFNGANYGSFMSDPVTGSAPTHNLQPYTTGTYNQPDQSLRTIPSTPVVNPYGTGDISARINALANNYFAQQQAQQQAQGMGAQAAYATGLNNLSRLNVSPQTAKSIFQGAYNMGLAGPPPAQNWHVGMTSQDNSNSLESQYAAQNRDVFGAANQANLLYYGVDPNAVSQAYQNFLNRNT